MSLARLRGAGMVPWLGFAAWLGIAASQEPVLLRSYGVCLVEQASWAGATVMLILLLLAEGRQPLRLGWIANLAMLSALAVLQSVCPLLIDLVRNQPHDPVRLVDIVGFFLCWAPFSLIYSAFPHRPRGGTVCVLVPAFALGCAHSVALRSSAPFHGVLSALVAAMAASVWALKSHK